MLPPAAYVAIRNAIGGDIAGACSSAELAGIAHGAHITTLGTIGGRRVILASLQATCICGNVNCPYLVLRLDPGERANVLLSTYAYDVAPAASGGPLPDLHESAHDSALIHVETVDTYRNGTYVPVASYEVRGDTGERKRLFIPIRFAPGTSSAPLTGRVATGWDDTYVLAAARGQSVRIGALQGPPGLSFSLEPAGSAGGTVIDLTPGRPARLPVTGTYHLLVQGATDDSRRYRATITIR